ncbi:MAG: hypothetical protein N4A33_09605 [Bacteriovoracaceae bacterium]|jgi:ADP-heptose:LPS heptosyltransferase|nr:hypothetical protein [Bacteriovoracaceae bacterium]
MKKILLTVLSGSSDIIGCANFISALKQNEPHSQIHLLCYERNEKYSHLIKDVNNIYLLNEQSIKSDLENPLYSNAFALNSFFDVISQIKDIQWDQVINYSNDLTSSYICSYLNANEKIGTTISQKGNPLTNNSWANYQNFHLPKSKEHFIGKHQIKMNICNLKNTNEKSGIKINEKLSLIAAKKFAPLKTSGLKVIGIDLSHSFSGQKWNINVLKSTIEELELCENTKVVLLTSGKTTEIDTINKLNSYFSNNLLSINYTLDALPSVLINIDFLISQSNATLMIADNLDCKVIEVIENNTKSNIIKEDNFIVESLTPETLHNDIFFILNQELDLEISINKLEFLNKSFQTIEDDFGITRTQINGPIDLKTELGYIVTRYYHNLICGKQSNPDLITHLKKNLSYSQIEEYLMESRKEVSSSIRILLNAIRSLNVANSSDTNLQNFIGHLDNLIFIGSTNSVTAACHNLFEGRLENIPSEQEEENLSFIENEIFNLKSDLQKLTTVLDQLSSPILKLNTGVKHEL